MDRRLTPFSGRVALEELAGCVDAEEYTKGEIASVNKAMTNLLNKPDGMRDRQLIYGDTVTLIDSRGGYSFVQALKDNYCGWVREDDIGPYVRATHWVKALTSHLYSGPKIQAVEYSAVPMGSLLSVPDSLGVSEKKGFVETTAGFVPGAHIEPLSKRPNDPASVAMMFLGSPYLWGGNTTAGLDCSGLVQASLLACGITCPGDSDLQKTLGFEVSETDSPCRGDLFFWRGHVAMALGEDRLIHANAHTMSVAIENISGCIDRIEKSGGGGVTARRRLGFDKKELETG